MNSKIKRSYIPEKHQGFWNEKKERDTKKAKLLPLIKHLEAVARLVKVV